MKLLFVILLTSALAIAKPNPKDFLVETEDVKSEIIPEPFEGQRYGNEPKDNEDKYGDEEPAEEGVKNRQDWDIFNFGLGK